MRTVVFGADGGGTKTLGLLADESRTILAEGTVGPSNAHVVGVETAAENLRLLIEQCCNAAGCTPSDVRCFVLGLAGAGRGALRSALRDYLERRLAIGKVLVIETDARVALEGTFGGDAGIVVVAGTGSVVIGKSEEGAIEMVGGWGRLLGDEGSGYALGVAALQTLAAFVDGRAPLSVLVEELVRETQATSRERLLAHVYENNFDPSRLAPIVVNAAQRGDATALAILHAGASALAQQVKSLAARLKFGSVVPVALLGGLMQGENIYAGILAQHVKENIPHGEIRAPLYSPAMGAVLMALRQADG